MAAGTATQRIKGGYYEDWDSGNTWLDGQDTVTINTDIEISGRASELELVDVIVYVDDILGSPSPTYPVVTRDASGKVQVDFENEAAVGEKMKWTARIDYRHSAKR